MRKMAITVKNKEQSTKPIPFLEDRENGDKIVEDFGVYHGGVEILNVRPENEQSQDARKAN